MGLARRAGGCGGRSHRDLGLLTYGVRGVHTTVMGGQKKTNTLGQKGTHACCQTVPKNRELTLKKE